MQPSGVLLGSVAACAGPCGNCVLVTICGRRQRCVPVGLEEAARRQHARHQTHSPLAALESIISSSHAAAASDLRNTFHPMPTRHAPQHFALHIFARALCVPLVAPFSRLR